MALFLTCGRTTQRLPDSGGVGEKTYLVLEGAETQVLFLDRIPPLL